MNKIIIQLQKENEKTIFKYMNQTNIKHYPQLFNMKSIIKKNLENDLSIKDDGNKNNEKQEELEEEKKKRKKNIDPELLEQYYKRNLQELLDNI